MQCSSPLTLVVRGKRQEVPCGHCVGCRVSRAREWSTRLLHEAAYWPSAAFVTLTYRDEDLPERGSLDKEELQRFHKRLRKALGRPMRYYACGEYGEQTARAHYHGIYFGLRPCSCAARPDELCLCSDRREVVLAWGHGGVDRLGTVTYDSCRYVADYIGKALSGSMGEAAYAGRGREAPFTVMSHGLGSRYVVDHQHQLAEQLSVTVHGVPVGLPRYYMHKLEALGYELPTGGRELEKVAPSKRRYAWYGNVPAHVLGVEAAREQRGRTARAKRDLFPKGSRRGGSPPAEQGP